MAVSAPTGNSSSSDYTPLKKKEKQDDASKSTVGQTEVSAAGAHAALVDGIRSHKEESGKKGIRFNYRDGNVINQFA